MLYNSLMKRLAVTMGDPGGIGPEIVVRALSLPEIRGICAPVVIGDGFVLDEAVRMLGLKLALRKVKHPSELGPEEGVIEYMDEAMDGRLLRGVPSAEGGWSSFTFVREAVGLAIKGRVDGIVTAPISKEALGMAGLPWPGHTEMLAELTGTREFAMAFVGGPLRVILVTIHEALKDVPRLIKKEDVLKKIFLARRTCGMFGIEEPKIAVAGLNPHAGEAGLFGREEIEEIAPAVSEARGAGIDATGPYPPDVIFHRALKGEFDIVVSMYHDQGLIPIKLTAFESAVNLTVGLPFVRTSPGHGTAFDIAWQGKASPGAMIEAIKTAAVAGV